MRPRGQPAAQSDAVTRRLELLNAELRAVNEPAADEHTHIRAGGPSDPWLSVLPSDAVAELPHGSVAELPLIASAEAPPVPTPGRHAARRGVGRALPVDLSALRGRVAITPAHLAVIAVMVAIGLAVTTWWVLRDDPGVPLSKGASAQPLATPMGGGAPTQPASSGPAPGETGESGESGEPGELGQPGEELVVDVTGKVRSPGIVVLAPGARVVDAIDAAGGARKGVSLRSLNLARVLQDGEQIVVGVAPAPGVAASTAPDAGSGDTGASGDLVNINTASATELEELSGVGPVTAEAIIEWRTSNGGFQSVDQLLEVDGIGEKTLADLSPHVTVG